jgi:hypothetical protein
MTKKGQWGLAKKFLEARRRCFKKKKKMMSVSRRPDESRGPTRFRLFGSL